MAGAGDAAGDGVRPPPDPEGGARLTGAPPGESRFDLDPRPRATTTTIRVGRGLLDRLPSLLAEHAPAAAYAIVSDDTVAGLYGERVRDDLAAAGATARLFTFPPGEASKTPERWAELVEGFGAMALGRDGCVLALGGGVTGDLGGFAAASYARGVPLVQLPTSLLAMIDASIGGKTGIDLRAGKNLAGAFHDPALVVADPATLDTLPDTELRTGLAEAVKHGAIADADYLHRLEEDAAAIRGRDPGALDRVLVGSIRIKTGVVGRDAREAGERAILNFGHTMGHGLERVTGYAVPHGQAVAMGMVAEAEVGEALGVTRPGTADRLRAALSAFGLPVSVPGHVEPGPLLAASRSDKKARAGRVHYVLLAEPGRVARGPDGAWTHAVEDEVVRAALARARGNGGRGQDV